MVGLTFIQNPNPELFKIINHIDGDRSNNFDWNLEWCDQKLNSIHGAVYGNMGVMNVREIDMVRELLLDPKYSGSPQKVYDEIKTKFSHITLQMIYSIKRNKSYQYSEKYNLSNINFPDCDYSNIPTTTLDKIRDLLISNDYSPSKVYKIINITHPEITLSIIKGVKSCRKEYMRSYKYNMNELLKLFNSHKEKGKGVDKRMQGINNNPTEVLDLCRDLLLTKTFHGSPTQLFKALNHSKYPNLTESILKKLVYDNVESSPYCRSNKYNLQEFFDRIKNRNFNIPNDDLIGRLISSYSSGFSDIADEFYDMLIEELVAEKGESSRPYLRVKKSDTVNSFTQTLSKVYGVIEPMREGQQTYAEWFRRKQINPNARITIQPKFDGCSVALDKAGRFFTRGDYQNGESVDVTELFQHYDRSKLLKDFMDGVKFEAILSHENFYGIDAFKEYKKPLDAVNAIIHSRNSELSKYITLVPLRRLIGKNQMVTPELQSVSIVTATADDFDTIQQFIVDKLNDGAKQCYHNAHFSIDGVVVSVLDDDFNTTEEIAIKILNDINETKLIDVRFQFGKTGKITPVAIVEPVLFCDGNRTIQNITLSTLDRVNQLNLRKGDTVRVMYNIVPYLLDSAHDGYERIQLPTHCPKCGAPFEYTSLKTVRCTNPDCGGRKLGSIIRYCEKMKMMGVGENTINTLYDEGLIKDIDDLYKLSVEDIVLVPGFKETSAKNIVKSIHDNSQNVPVCRWLGALPFLDVDAKKWELILNHVYGPDEMVRSNAIRHIFTEAPEEFDDAILIQGIRGVGNATLKALHEGFLSNQALMSRVIKNITFNVLTRTTNLGKVCLTGTRDKTVIEYLTGKGYSVSDNLTKDTVLVVRPDPMFESSKTKRANELGIKIITIQEALGL